MDYVNIFDGARPATEMLAESGRRRFDTRINRPYETGRSGGRVKMLWFYLGVMRVGRKKEGLRKENIRVTAQVGKVEDRVREGRLGWFGHLQRRDSGYIDRDGAVRREVQIKTKQRFMRI